MRIFFVTNSYTPYSGGVISSIIATTDALRSQGHEVFIITLDFLDTHQHNDPDYVIRVTCPIKFMYKKNHMAIPWRPMRAIIELCKKYCPDIIHVHHPFLLGVSALHAARSYGIPCIFTYHTLYEQYAHYIPLPKVCIKPLIQLTVVRFCKLVDGIIAPSSAVKKFLSEQRITTPIIVIPSALRSVFFTQDKVNDSLYTKKPYELLVVSRFVPEKNIPFVFDVFKLLPEEFNLTLVGYGIDYKKIKQYAFDIVCLSPDRVRFIHKPPIDDLLLLYRNADFFIFPSQTDTQGIVLAEAMSQGLPVIALDGPGQQDIIINGVNGFIVTDEQHAAITIINTLSNPTLYHQLREGACTTAQKYHSHNIIKKIINFYQDILY
ncbi:MAG TPA: glycosyltransferase [Candidatus Babeliales bacterium]|nr:glycosyltransferase [Candidatus Babeliales bacterium]